MLMLMLTGSVSGCVFPTPPRTQPALTRGGRGQMSQGGGMGGMFNVGKAKVRGPA
jgi:hypothetical protein